MPLNFDDLALIANVQFQRSAKQHSFYLINLFYVYFAFVEIKYAACVHLFALLTAKEPIFLKILRAFSLLVKKLKHI